MDVQSALNGQADCLGMLAAQRDAALTRVAALEDEKAGLLAQIDQLAPRQECDPLPNRGPDG